MSTTSRYYEAGSPIGRDSLKGPAYGKQQEFDSGIDSTTFCETLPMQVEADSARYSSGVLSGRPKPPELMGRGGPVDFENGDSGVIMGEEDEDDLERDCVSTHPKMGPVHTQVPMEIDTTSVRKVIPRSANRSPPAPATKRPVPRLPKRTVPTSSFTSSVTNHGVRTVTAPQRSPSPRSVFSQRYHPSPSTHTTTLPTHDKENYGPYSLPAVRSTSPLTCNNFRSLNPERVPTPGVSIDIYQLREYMSFFLPDTKDGDT